MVIIFVHVGAGMLTQCSLPHCHDRDNRFTGENVCYLYTTTTKQQKQNYILYVFNYTYYTSVLFRISLLSFFIIKILWIIIIKLSFTAFKRKEKKNVS